MGVWLDELQQKQVPVPIAISEYGADGILTYQTGSPTRGDYSESYQSLYHEEPPVCLCAGTRDSSAGW